MLRRPVVAALVLVAFVALGGTGPAGAHETDDPGDSAPPGSSAAYAWVLADADTGAVLAALNHHEPVYIASLVKVMTAIVTLEQLQMTNEIEVNELAASKPAMRIGMQTGQRWQLDHALHSLLMVSANDAAFALAEAASGSVDEFARAMQRTGQRMGMEDSTWRDPAGFDGDEGFEGGTTASAYDLAAMSRNATEYPEIMEIVAKPTYEFHGGDGIDHRLINHNKMLSNFAGITGLKTGYTRAAGHTYIATAERDGRRLIAVVLRATDHYGTAAALLEQGFSTPPDAKGTGEVLPETNPAETVSPEPEPEIAASSENTVATTTEQASSLRSLTMLALGSLAVAFFARREQIKRRKRRRLARRLAYLDAKRRGMIDVIDAERYYGHAGTSAGTLSAHVRVQAPGQQRDPTGARR